MARKVSSQLTRYTPPPCTPCVRENTCPRCTSIITFHQSLDRLYRKVTGGTVFDRHDQAVEPPSRYIIAPPFTAGHTQDLTPILAGADTTTGDWFFDALGWNDFLTWDKQGGETACGLLVATFSHHGRPLQLEGGRSRNPEIWQDFGGLSPRACA